MLAKSLDFGGFRNMFGQSPRCAMVKTWQTCPWWRLSTKDRHRWGIHPDRCPKALHQAHCRILNIQSLEETCQMWCFLDVLVDVFWDSWHEFQLATRFFPLKVGALWRNSPATRVISAFIRRCAVSSLDTLIWTTLKGGGESNDLWKEKNGKTYVYYILMAKPSPEGQTVLRTNSKDQLVALLYSYALLVPLWEGAHTAKTSSPYLICFH